MLQQPDLVIMNAEVLTMDTSRPRAQAVAAVQDRILAVGENDEVQRLAGPGTQVIDGHGLTLLPGFMDSHIHLLSLARTTQELDCRPDKAAAIGAITHRVFEWARIVPPGEWVRCFGYDDLALDERRHPNRHDLDEVSPRHPVRLDHRSGHATVLNSLGLQLAGINADTPDPVEGVIERDANGEPTGVLFEMASYLSQRVESGRSRNKMRQGVTAANRLLLGYGITSTQDAGQDNGPERWQAFRELIDSETLQTRVTMMAGAGRRAELFDAGLSWGSGGHRLRLGHVKIMLTMSTGALHPSLEGLRETATEASRSGYPVAVHCVEQEAIAAAAQVISELPPLPPGVPPHRIEHCSECPSEVLDAVRRSGCAVVTQPGFIHWNGPSYRQNVEASLQAHLYAIGGMRDADIPLAFGSDAPVINPNPWPAIHSAVTRQDYQGQPVPDTGGSGRVSVQSALRMYTLSGAELEGTAEDKGSISPGKLADLVLVDANPLTVDPEGLKDIKAMMTIIGGRVVWEGK
ncbi:MAG: amidohydrolase [Chloroflexi bacterium]|nr:amidohydrolase [Chloroflexota bacterium]